MAKQKPAFEITWGWLIQRPVCFIGFGFGTGLAPKAPGTVGPLPAVLIGIWICNETERTLGVHDYGGIVWDEIVAMMLIYACVPQGLGWWAVSFAVFRFFDAVKPPPIKWFDQRVSGGLGVMLDDVIAAVLSIVVIWLLVWLC